MNSNQLVLILNHEDYAKLVECFENKPRYKAIIESNLEVDKDKMTISLSRIECCLILEAVNSYGLRSKIRNFILLQDKEFTSYYESIKRDLAHLQ